MSELSSKTFCVLDHGFFIPVARRLAESGAKVYYQNLAWPKAYPMLNDGVLGDGTKDIEMCLDFWPLKDKIDCFVFPDLGHMGLQKELRSQGFAVWGAMGGMRLEQDREFFLNKLESLGLDVPPHEIVVGVSALRDYLQDKEDIWIKMSTWRGSWETKHWRNQKVDGHHLDCWAVKFGGIREQVVFLCFPKIDTKLEIGADTYCIDGQWPKLMLHGIEKKDEAYFSAVTEREKMPEELTHIMDAFSPFLGQVGYRCQWSMEGPNKGSNTKHGWHGTRTYQCWNAMIMRCSRTGKEWHRYGGRGITVCQRWRNFVHFLEDMGTKPDGMMLERINNDGNYEPSNCRWATRKEQCRNRSQNLMITHNGITLCSADWSFKLGGKTRTLVRDRIKRYGWSSERAVTTPVSVFVRTIHNAET